MALRKGDILSSRRTVCPDSWTICLNERVVPYLEAFLSRGRRQIGRLRGGLHFYPEFGGWPGVLPAPDYHRGLERRAGLTPMVKPGALTAASVFIQLPSKLVVQSPKLGLWRQARIVNRCDWPRQASATQISITKQPYFDLVLPIERYRHAFAAHHGSVQGRIWIVDPAKWAEHRRAPDCAGSP